MEKLSKLWRKIKRSFLYIKAFLLSVILRREIKIRIAQISEQHLDEPITGSNFCQISYQVRVATPNRIFYLEILRFAPEPSTFNKIALAVKIAEDICFEQCLPKTPVFIDIGENMLVTVIVEVNK